MATEYITNIYSSRALDCVNDIIGSIGEPSVTSLDTSNVDVVNALRILDRENRVVQSEGWTFNTLLNKKLLPDVFSNQIMWLPSYISLIEPSNRTRYINRAGFVHDRVNETNYFSSPIIVNLIEYQDLDEMPDCFIQLIVARSIRRFNSEYFGAAEIDGKWEISEAQAKQRCMEYELDYGKYNMFSDDAFVMFQKYR